MMAHTPLPWKVNGTDIRATDVRGDTGTISLCHGELSERNKANAAFIVRACNGWYDIAALRQRLQELEAANG